MRSDTDGASRTVESGRLNGEAGTDGEVPLTRSEAGAADGEVAGVARGG